MKSGSLGVLASGDLVTAMWPGQGGAGECLVQRWLLDTAFPGLAWGTARTCQFI